MDRRQQKTREAIFQAFGELLERKHYNHITVQEIIDGANVGRSTFYAHFETKDDLLKALCGELFGHIINSAVGQAHTHGLKGGQSGSVLSRKGESHAPRAIFCHLLQHLEKNDRNILGLLSCESNEIFLRCFKDSLNELVAERVVEKHRCSSLKLPEGFLINHISGSFVEMVLWWIKGGQKETPEELDGYFCAVMGEVL